LSYQEFCFWPDTNANPGSLLVDFGVNGRASDLHPDPEFDIFAVPDPGLVFPQN